MCLQREHSNQKRGISMNDADLRWDFVVGEKKEYIVLVKTERKKSTESFNDFFYFQWRIVQLSPYNDCFLGEMPEIQPLVTDHSNLRFLYVVMKLPCQVLTCTVYVNISQPKLCSGLMDLERWEPWIQRLRLKFSL